MKLPIGVRIVLSPFRVVALVCFSPFAIILILSGCEDIETDISDFILEAGNK